MIIARAQLLVEYGVDTRRTCMSTTQNTSGQHASLADETFMSAADLRNYMAEMSMAHASDSLSAMDQAEKAREELIRTLSEPVKVTPEKIAEVSKRVQSSLRSAAQRGEAEVMIMRFPNVLCSDKGRAINNAEEGWPETLTGRPRQAYQFWHEFMQPNGYRLRAMIIEWPGGLPGDVGMFVSWGDKKAT
jgi:hypothetical protein